MIAAYKALESNIKSNLEKSTAKRCYCRAQFDPDEHRPVQIRTKEQATKSQFVYSHRYEVGDILLFDNISTMHRAKEQTDAGDAPDSDNARLL